MARESRGLLRVEKDTSEGEAPADPVLSLNPRIEEFLDGFVLIGYRANSGHDKVVLFNCGNDAAIADALAPIIAHATGWAQHRPFQKQ